MMMVVPGLAWGDILWRGDFETGDRSQFTGAQMVSADRLQVVTSPVAEGRYALKATVRQGDDPINSSGNRNELVYQGREKEGSEYYYRWKVMFAEDFPSVRTWQLFTQWHHDGCCGSPPVEFFVYGEEIRLTLNDSVTPWTTKLVRGVWHEFIFHVRWSPDPAVGFVELWHNGQLVLPKRHIGTMYAGDGIYLKLGLYRSDTVTQVGVVYHDGFMQATTLQDVLGTVTEPTPDAGSPAVDAGTPATDAGTPATDAGTPRPDAGTSGPDAGTPRADAGTSGTDAGPPAVDAGTPATDAGTQVTDAGTSAPVDDPRTEVPGQTTNPDVDGVPEPPFAEQAPPYGCSVGGGPLAALALVGLVGAARIRRRRR
jgi:MYXO-CTERM domain-containing protein